MKVDPPGEPGVALTPASLVNYARSYGVEVCQDNGLDEVEFEFAWAEFRVTAEGFLETTMDVTNDVEKAKEIHHGH